jgi:hypothetical protein
VNVMGSITSVGVIEKGRLLEGTEGILPPNKFWIKTGIYFKLVVHRRH